MVMPLIKLHLKRSRFIVFAIAANFYTPIAPAEITAGSFMSPDPNGRSCTLVWSDGLREPIACEGEKITDMCSTSVRRPVSVELKGDYGVQVLASFPSVAEVGSECTTNSTQPRGISTRDEGIFDIPAGTGYRFSGIPHPGTGRPQVRIPGNRGNLHFGPGPTQMLLTKTVLGNGLCVYSSDSVAPPFYTQWRTSIWLQNAAPRFETTAFLCGSFELKFFDAVTYWCSMNPSWHLRCGGDGRERPPPGYFDPAG